MTMLSKNMRIAGLYNHATALRNLARKADPKCPIAGPDVLKAAARETSDLARKIESGEVNLD